MENNSENNDMKKMKLKPTVYQSILEKAVLSKLTFPPAASFGSDMQTNFLHDGGVEIVLTMEKAVWREVYCNYDLSFIDGETRRFIVSDTPLAKAGYECFSLYRYRKTGGIVVDFHIYIEKVNSYVSSIFDIKLSPEVAFYKRDYHKDHWELTGFSLQKVDNFEPSSATSLFFRKYEYDSFSEAVSAFLMNLGKSQEVLKEAEQLIGLTQAESFCRKNFEDLLQEQSITKIIPINYNEKTSTFEINFLKQDSVYFMIYQSNDGKFWLFLQQGESKRLPYVTWCDYHGETQEAKVNFVAELLTPYWAFWKENQKKRKRRDEEEESDKVNRELDLSPKQKVSKIPDKNSDISFQTPDKRKTDEGDYSNSDMLVDQPN